MAEFFKTIVENLEESIPQMFHQVTRRNPRKDPRQGNLRSLTIQKTRAPTRNLMAKSFSSSMTRADKLQINALYLKH